MSALQFEVCLHVLEPQGDYHTINLLLPICGADEHCAQDHTASKQWSWA